MMANLCTVCLSNINGALCNYRVHFFDCSQNFCILRAVDILIITMIIDDCINDDNFLKWNVFGMNIDLQN